MLGRKTLEADGELDVAGADDVLDLEIRKLGIEAKLLDDAGILARRELGIIFRLGARHDHLAAREDEGSRLGLANAHDHGSEALGVVLLRVRTAQQHKKPVEQKLGAAPPLSSERGRSAQFLAQHVPPRCGHVEQSS